MLSGTRRHRAPARPVLAGLALALGLLLPSHGADAQGVGPPAVNGTSRTLTGPATVTPYGVGPRVHMDYAGHACVSITATAEAEKANANVFQHFLHVTNRCGQSIKIKACYRHSDRCIQERIFGYQKRDYTLGIAANEKAFDYTYRELFP